MGLELLGKVGPAALTDGDREMLRLGKSAEAIVQQLHGRFYEACVRGKLFSGVTAAAGVAPGTAIGTTPPFTLYNPKNSGKRLVVVESSIGYISGTLGAGVLAYVASNVPTDAAPSGGTAIAVRNMLIGGVAGVGLAYTGPTIASTPVLLKPVFNLTALLASTAVGLYQMTDNVEGKIVIDEGCALSMQGIAAAGSSPLIICGMTWEEVDK